MQTRETLKQALLNQVNVLGQEALLPAQTSELDGMVQELERLNPTPAPLASENRSLLLGDWRLVYASNGTVVTRRLPGGITINAIWQTLNRFTGEPDSELNEGAIAATNGMEMALPLIGTVQMQANGSWRWQGETQTATVAFDAFTLQASALFHQADWQLPALQIPVLEWLRREAIWETSYLDGDLRIGRGVTGNRFVFVRSL